ncbi:CBS domain-containing protein [Modestobacter lapidis]|nr:CBS domain-containing protein [Modestobacter lapidis]
MSVTIDRERTTVAGTDLALRPRHATVRPVAVPAGPQRRRVPRTAADVMIRYPLTIGQSDTLWTAWGRLRGTRHQHLVVVDDHRRPVGVLDERAIAVEWPPGPAGPDRVPVHTLLRGHARPRVRASEDLAKVAQVMLGAGADAVPVVDRQGRLFGLVTLWHYAQLAAGDPNVPTVET